MTEVLQQAAEERGAAAATLDGVRVAFVVANEGVEEVELTEPWRAILEAGGQPTLLAPRTGDVQLMRHLDKSGIVHAELETAAATSEGFDAVVLPGGVANPDQLRMDAAAVAFVWSMFQAGQPAAVICHGPWTLIEADVVRDRTLTSWPSLATDIANAGGNWRDEPVVTCTNGPNVLVTSRNPDDLEIFCSTLVGTFAEHTHLEVAS